VLGEMGIGNKTAAAAIYHAPTAAGGGWVGRGLASTMGLRRKADAVRAAVARHKPYTDDPLRVPARPAGAKNGDRRRDLAAACAELRCCSTARVCFGGGRAAGLDDAALDHCLAAHLSAERAHRHALKLLGKTPLLDLGMRLGEGSGAALAVGIVKAAVACHNGMATFAEAGVAGREEP
jgi:nicotinate-nucleotide--dimethylbenzimidazole phosphoribosyltransferase